MEKTNVTFDNISDAVLTIDSPNFLPFSKVWTGVGVCLCSKGQEGPIYKVSNFAASKSPTHISKETASSHDQQHHKANKRITIP